MLRLSHSTSSSRRGANPSIEWTFNSGLRPLSAAPHVKRFSFATFSKLDHSLPMNFHRLFLIGTTVFLAGCASSFVYKRAEGPTVATLRLTNASDKWIRAMESHRGDCRDMWSFGDNQESIYPGASRTTTIAPATFLVLNIVGKVGLGVGTGAAGSFSVSSCSFNVGFTAEPNASYEITYGGSNGGCTLEARTLTSAGPQPLTLTKMTLKNAFGPQSCVKADM